MNPRLSPIYTFGSFRLDPMRGKLYQGSEIVLLPERLARLLLLLIRANGDVIDKDTIISKIWPESAVTDGNLSQHVYMLRQVLNERAQDRDYIVTVRNRGYRFVAPVSVIAPELDASAERNYESAGRRWRSEPEVIQHYCRGCYLLEKRTASALAAAAQQFEGALRVQQDYVPALIGLARAYEMMAQYWYAPGSYTFPKAKAAIMRALEVDSSSAEARAVLGNIILFCEWNWVAAEREIETAVRLNPKSTFVYEDAAWFYLCKGSRETPLREMERALLVEPSSPILQLCLARVFLHSGEYGRAIDAFSDLIESVPDLSIARRHRAQAFILNGQPAEALTDLLVMPVDRAEDLALRLPLLARAYADCGDTERAEQIYQLLLETARAEYVVNFNLAMVAVGLQRLEQALEHLERALQRREPAMLLLRGLPLFVPIAQRARFKALLWAIGPHAEPLAKSYTGGVESPIVTPTTSTRTIEQVVGVPRYPFPAKVAWRA